MKDARTENKLIAGGYAYKFVPNFDLSKIDWDAAVSNPARLGRKIDEHRITGIGLALLDGVDIPAIVVILHDDGNYEVATGCHRGLAAKEAKVSTLDAYVVVEADPYRREILIKALNTVEGVNNSHAENLAHIADLLERHPTAAAKDLAAAFGVKGPQISDYLSLLKFQARADKLDVKHAFLGLQSNTIRLRLGRLSSDTTFVEAVRLLSQTRIVGKEADELIAKIRREPTEAAASKLIANTLQTWEAAQKRAAIKFGKRQGRATSTKYMQIVRRLYRFMPIWSVNKLHLGDRPRDEIAEDKSIVKELMDQLQDVYDDLDNLEQKYRKEEAWRNEQASGERTSAPTSLSI